MAATSGLPLYKEKDCRSSHTKCNSILSNKAGSCEVYRINILAALRNTVHLQLKNQHYRLSSYIDGLFGYKYMLQGRSRFSTRLIYDVYVCFKTFYRIFRPYQVSNHSTKHA